MLGIFEAIGDFFSGVWNVLNFIFSAIGMLFNLVVDGMSFLISLVSILPAPLIAGAVALIVVCVLYKILGRENQS